MDDFVSAIIRRGKIQSPEEHDIVFEEWKRIFYSGAAHIQKCTYITVLHKQQSVYN